jgi:hypothetical protein
MDTESHRKLQVTSKCYYWPSLKSFLSHTGQGWTTFKTIPASIAFRKTYRSIPLSTPVTCCFHWKIPLKSDYRQVNSFQRSERWFPNRQFTNRRYIHTQICKIIQICTFTYINIRYRPTNGLPFSPVLLANIPELCFVLL